MSRPLSVPTLRQTSVRHPLQWEGEADDDRSVSITYHHGVLTAMVGAEGGLYFRLVSQDKHSNYLSYDQLRALIAPMLALPDEVAA